MGLGGFVWFFIWFGGFVVFLRQGLSLTGLELKLCVSLLRSIRITGMHRHTGVELYYFCNVSVSLNLPQSGFKNSAISIPKYT